MERSAPCRCATGSAGRTSTPTTTSANSASSGRQTLAHRHSVVDISAETAAETPAWRNPMGTRAELELLDYLEDGAESMADEAELTGLARREFVFLSLMSAAATTFGFGARAMAQAAPAGGQAPQAPPPPPLGNGEPVSWTFQPYPGGTGALMEKLVRERGPNAFRRSAFGVQRWNGPVPNAPEDIAFLPAHRLSALIRERKLTSTQVTRIYLDRLKRLDPT